jgi:hypothetical protein
MPTGAFGRVHWRSLVSMPQGIFFSAGLVLCVGGLALGFSEFPPEANDFPRVQLALAIVVMGSALTFCASAFGRLLERPMMLTHIIPPRLARLVAVALTVLVLALAVGSSVPLVAVPLVAVPLVAVPLVASHPFSSSFWLLLGAMGGYVLLSLWNVAILITVPPQQHARASRAR